MNALKIVLVGDAEVGKTWFVSQAKELYATLHDYYSLMKEPFDYDLVYSPTVFETCFSNIDTTQLGNYQTNIWDTGGCAILDWQRPLAYIRADVFMLCFDISNRESFRSVTERWLPELRKYEPDTPVLIVGTKADLRDQTARKVIFQGNTPLIVKSTMEKTLSYFLDFFKIFLHCMEVPTCIFLILPHCNRRAFCMRMRASAERQ